MNRNNFIPHAWFCNPVIFSLICAFILWLDFQSTMSLQNLVFKEFSITTAGFNTIGIILVLDGLGLIAGQFAAERLSRRQITRLAVSSLIVTIVLFIALTFGQRILSEDLLFNSVKTVNTYVKSGEVVSEQTISAQTSLLRKLSLAILGLLPVATTVMAFSLSAIKADYDLNNTGDKLNKRRDAILEELLGLQNTGSVTDPGVGVVMDGERKKGQLDIENHQQKVHFKERLIAACDNADTKAAIASIPVSPPPTAEIPHAVQAQPQHILPDPLQELPHAPQRAVMHTEERVVNMEENITNQPEVVPEETAASEPDPKDDPLYEEDDVAPDNIFS